MGIDIEGRAEDHRERAQYLRQMIEATPARPDRERLVELADQYEQLVPLHRGFDELIVAGAEGRQRFGIDQHLDASGYAGLASDQPVAFEGEHHLVD